jgi:hypothetical protein
VKQAASAHAGQPVNWVVVDVAQQPSFRRAYGFSADQLPALLALSTKRMRFAQVGTLAMCIMVATAYMRVASLNRKHASSSSRATELLQVGQSAWLLAPDQPWWPSQAVNESRFVTVSLGMHPSQ